MKKYRVIRYLVPIEIEEIAEEDDIAKSLFIKIGLIEENE